MTLSSQEVHIRSLKPEKGRLYYYQGNFYHPLTLHGDTVGKVRRAIRDFKTANKALVAADRASPDYRNLVQIFDDHLKAAVPA